MNASLAERVDGDDVAVLVEQRAGGLVGEELRGRGAIQYKIFDLRFQKRNVLKLGKFVTIEKWHLKPKLRSKFLLLICAPGSCRGRRR